VTPEAEVLSVGGRRRPAKPPRRLLAAAALLVVTGLGGWQLLRGDPAGKPAPAAPAASSVASSSVATPSVGTPSASFIPQPQRSAESDHLVMAERTGAKLVLGGDTLLDVGLDDGYVRWTTLPGTTLETVHVRTGDVMLVTAPGDRIPAPIRARFKSPLRYHNLSWGHNETCAVTTTGRLARVTAWVPLTKVQSLRLIQGPLQRRLRLATVYLDTAGRSLHAAIRDRDAREAGLALVELTALCRAARQSGR